MSSNDIKNANNYETDNKITNSINPEKTGKFIRELRKAHNLTQEEFGEKLFVTRKAVSKWETGHACPSIDVIKMMGDIYGVDIDEILDGEFNSDSMYLEKNQKLFRRILRSKYTKVISIIVAIIVFLTLIIFYFENHNSTKVYTVYYEDENFALSNGTIIFSNSKEYINLGTLDSTLKEIKNNLNLHYELYYIKNEKDKVVIFSYQLNGLYYSDTHEYNEIKSVDLKNNIDNLYLKISYENEDNELKKYELHLTVESVSEDDNFNFKKIDFESWLEENNNYNNIIDSNASSNESTEEESESISLEFLYEMTDEEIKSKYNNKNLFIDNEKYQVKFNNDYEILIEKPSIQIYINYKNNSVLIFDEIEYVSAYSIDKNHYLIIQKSDKKIEFLKDLIYGLIKL